MNNHEPLLTSWICGHEIEPLVKQSAEERRQVVSRGFFRYVAILRHKLLTVRTPMRCSGGSKSRKHA